MRIAASRSCSQRETLFEGRKLRGSFLYSKSDGRKNDPSEVNKVSTMTTETRRAVHLQWRQAVRRASQMEPKIWEHFPEDLIPRVLRHLPWWSNMQLRSTCASWKALLTDVKFLANCPPSDQRAIPCFTSLTLLQNPEGSSSQLDILMCCLKSRNYNPETESSGRSSPAKISTWNKWHAESSPLMPSLHPPACCDISASVRGKSYSELAPVSGIFLDSIEVDQTYRLILMNPFNSTIRQLPPLPSLGSRCSVQSGCSRCAQLIADDENPKNVKIIFPHFAYDDMNMWTLIVYDLEEGSWTVEGDALPIHLQNSYSNPTSIACLSGSVYILVQSLRTGPRLLRFLGKRLSVYSMPVFLHGSLLLYLFRHRSSLMLARGKKKPCAQLDIWRLKMLANQEWSWERVAVMPKVLFAKLCTDPNTRNEMDEEFVKFYVNGDFMCFKPSQSDRSVFVILLDLVKWRWEFITSDDGVIEGFFICQPRLEIVL